MSRFSRKSESRLNVSNIFNENENGGSAVSGISTFSSPHYFVPPSGTTAERPSNPGEGMIRFNTDSGHLEYYRGNHWVDVITNNNELLEMQQILVIVVPLQNKEILLYPVP